MSDLDHEAVKAYRDQFKFCPSPYRRREIVVTVKDLDLWKEVLASWGYWKDGKWIKYNPLNVNGLLQEYERQARNIKSVNQPRISSEDRQAGVSRWSNSEVLEVRRRMEIESRASQGTLEQIVSQALRAEDRS